MPTKTKSTPRSKARPSRPARSSSPASASSSRGPSWFNPRVNTGLTEVGSEPDVNSIIPRMYEAWGAYGYQPSVTWYQLCNMYVSWEYTACEKIARSLASLPAKLYRYEKVGTGKTIKPYSVKSMLLGNYGLTSMQIPAAHKALKESGIKRVEVDDHPFLDLVNKPNDEMVRMEFWRLLATYLELDGAVGIYKAKKDMFGNPTALYILPTTWTGQFKPVPARDGIRLIGGYKLIDQDLCTHFDPSEIIWIHITSLRNPFEGMSPIKAQLYAFNLDQYIMQQLTAFYKNGAMFSNLFETDHELTQDQYNEIAAQLNSYQGAKNAFKKFILHSGLKVSKPMNTTAREAMVDEVSNYARDKLLSAHDLSVGKLGMEAMQNRSNLEVVDMAFFNESIRPRATLITEYFDMFCVKNYDDRLDFEFEYPAFDDRALNITERQANLSSGYTSINEEREKEGKVPLKGGEEPRVSPMLIPLSQSGVSLFNRTSDNETSEENEDEVGENVTPEKEETTPPAKSLETKAFWTPERKSIAWKQYDKVASSFEPLFVNIAAKHFSKALALSIEALEKNGVKIKSNIATKGLHGRQVWLAENKDRVTECLPDKKELEKHLQSFLLPALAEAMKGGAEHRIASMKELVGNTKAKKPVEVNITFNIENPYVAKWLGKRTKESAKSITKTTIDNVQKILRDDFENREGLSTMAAHLRTHFTEEETYRAAMIARTEVTAATSQGDIEAVRQMGLEGRVAKVWINEPTARDTHKEAGERYSDGYDAETGKPVLLDDSFKVGADTMTAPGNGLLAEENINCRCGLVYEILEETE